MFTCSALEWKETMKRTETNLKCAHLYKAMSCHPRWRLKHLVRVLLSCSRVALGAPGPHKKALEPLQTLISSYTGDDLSKRLKRFFKLIFVRELLDRLISAYTGPALKTCSSILKYQDSRCLSSS